MIISRRTLLRGAAAAVAMAGAAPAWAAPAKRPPLSSQDSADVARAEAYLNGITTLKARFLQVAPNGTPAEGTAYLSRPGRLRMQYDPPSPLLVVADGNFLIVHDKTLDAPSYIPLNSTPAGVLVRSDVRLNGTDLTVTAVNRQPGVLSIGLVQASDPGVGQLTLVFSDAPFALRQWQVVDAQGQVTSVSLYEAQLGLKLDGKLFEFSHPSFDKVKLNDG